jgi:glycerol uptake facilitator-like aquaporin
MRDDDDFELMRQLIVEFIGTFALMFFGGGAIIVTAAEGLGRTPACWSSRWRTAWRLV